MSAVVRRLEHLATLEDGWRDGEGLAPSQCALQLARDMAVVFERGGQPPAIFPTEDGGVLMEWSLKDAEVSIEINWDGQVADIDVAEIPLADQPSREEAT